MLDRDPAAKWWELPLYPCVYALMFHRIAHVMWRVRLPLAPRLLSRFSHFLTGIEIHPGATIGRCFFIDHGLGTIIGETCEIGDYVTLFQGVTLGGSGSKKRKRHPTLGNHVVVAAGAKLLGPIEVGEYSKIGANAVVVEDVPANATVVGIPGRIVRLRGTKLKGRELDHHLLPDPVVKRLKDLEKSLDRQADV